MSDLSRSFYKWSDGFLDEVSVEGAIADYFDEEGVAGGGVGGRGGGRCSAKGWPVMMNSWQRLVAVGLAVYPTWEVKAESLDSELFRAALALQGSVETIDGQPQYVAQQLPLPEYEILTRRAFVFVGPYVARRTLYVKILWSLFALEQGLVWVPTIAIILILRRVTIGKESILNDENRAP